MAYYKASLRIGKHFQVIRPDRRTVYIRVRTASPDMRKIAFPLVLPERSGLNRVMVLSSAPTAIPANSQPDPNFGALLQAVGQKQDRAAFIQLFNHFAPRIKSFLIKGGAKPDQAEELAQEAMMTVWTRAATYDPKQANAGTWIFTIARNKRIDALRKTGRMVVGIEDPAYIPDDSPHADSGILDSQRMAKIADAIKDLPPEQSDLIRKSFFEDKTHAQISAEDNIPLGTVKSRLRLAMDRLRPKLGKEYL